jgi:single-stranded-DNA-specific exonuclease
MRWIERPVPNDSLNALTAAGIHPVLARLYAARGMQSAEDMNLSISAMAKPASMLGLEDAAARLGLAITNSQPIVIVGDFDCDGATSTALLVDFIHKMGGLATYIIPDRVTQGYGLSPAISDIAAKAGAQLLITVDNGISAIAGVETARQHGMDVIVTDHHLPGDELPRANMIVNPNQPGCTFPYRSTCGVGVAFYLAGQTWRWLVQQGHVPAKPSVMPDYLDLVALGTVADVVPLEHNNRILIHAGLRRIAAGLARPGIQALMEVAGVNPQTIKEQALGFSLGPRCNAAGRLDNMRKGVDLLLSRDAAESLSIAKELDQLNRDRRAIENTMLESAILAFERLDPDTDHAHEKGICLLDPEGHEGVVGLVASRLRERHQKPAIVFAPGGDAHVLKGSARSVDGVHIRDLIAHINATHPGLIRAFGGHAMAAGLSIESAHFAKFQEAFLSECFATVPDEALQETVITDGVLDPSDIHLDVAELLESGGPWGQGFPPPLFHGTFTVVESKRIGQESRTLRLGLRAGNRIFNAIRFRQDDSKDPVVGDECHIAYTLEVNSYRGNLSAQLMVRAFL